jgi:hypothetical protein
VPRYRRQGCCHARRRSGLAPTARIPPDPPRKPSKSVHRVVSGSASHPELSDFTPQSHRCLLSPYDMLTERTAPIRVPSRHLAIDQGWNLSPGVMRQQPIKGRLPAIVLVHYLYQPHRPAGRLPYQTATRLLHVFRAAVMEGAEGSSPNGAGVIDNPWFSAADKGHGRGPSCRRGQTSSRAASTNSTERTRCT